MCLAIPMKVIEVNDNKGIVETGGIQKTVDFSLLGSVPSGSYVIVHAGFAIQSMNIDEARKTLALFDEMTRLVVSEKQ
jgi:hydrogenase expression/formation protein HypC